MFKIKKGFTLVEMLIVIVIIGILAAAILPRLLGAQDRARDVAISGDLNTINTAMQSYAIDHNGAYPAGCGVTISSVSGSIDSYLTTVPTTTPKGDDYTYCNFAGGYAMRAKTETIGGGNHNVLPALIATSTGLILVAPTVETSSWYVLISG